MMLKVLVYAYSEKIFTSRRIAKWLRENVNMMWLAGGNRPDFRTINRFRGEVMKGEVREVFSGVLELLIEEGYVKLENYFACASAAGTGVDGTKIGADANLHKVVWAKKTEKYKARLREKIKVLLDEIERLNEQENDEYGDEDLEEMGQAPGLTKRFGSLPKLQSSLNKPQKRIYAQCISRFDNYQISNYRSIIYTRCSRCCHHDLPTTPPQKSGEYEPSRFSLFTI